jgi:uncharacterized RDD family membrane protein YckC
MTTRYGGLASRFLANVVDVVILAILVAGTQWILDQWARQVLVIDVAHCPPTDLWWRPRPHLCRLLPWIGPLAVLVYPVVYRVGFWTLTGWTPGMSLMGLRLVRTNGSRVRLATALLRMLAGILTALTLGAGYLLILVSPRRQALHDRLAGTLMLQARAARPPKPSAPDAPHRATGA